MTVENGLAQEKRHDEHQYLDLLRQVLESGEKRADRTGTGTLSLFAPQHFSFSLDGNILPLLTTKRVFTRGVIEELLWFIRGATESISLSEKGVRIWEGNSSREFLEKRGLSHYQDGELGPIYGFQWRHFGAKWIGADKDYTGQGVDQLAQVINTIKTNPTDRRIILTAWNPADLDKMVLPPCHMMCQFYVTLPSPENGASKPLLSCMMYQRSADLGLGVPFNIASYALLTHMIAQVTNTQAHRFVLQLGDAHIYSNHIEPLKTQLDREPRPFPKLSFKRDIQNIDDFVYDDFVIEGYTPHPKIEMEMSA